MVEKINTGGRWAWVLSPTGIHKAGQRRSKNKGRGFREDLEDRYAGKGREESAKPSIIAEPAAANDTQTADETPENARSPERGRRIDVRA